MTITKRKNNNGVNIKDVSAMLGHAQTSTTMDIYAHAIEKVNKNAFKSVAEKKNLENS